MTVRLMARLMQLEDGSHLSVRAVCGAVEVRLAAEVQVVISLIISFLFFYLPTLGDCFSFALMEGIRQMQLSFFNCIHLVSYGLIIYLFGAV